MAIGEKFGRMNLTWGLDEPNSFKWLQQFFVAGGHATRGGIPTRYIVSGTGREMDGLVDFLGLFPKPDGHRKHGQINEAPPSLCNIGTERASNILVLDMTNNFYHCPLKYQCT